jgi:rare lipoprotein A (peptidoglycan hydrolase)
VSSTGARVGLLSLVVLATLGVVLALTHRSGGKSGIPNPAGQTYTAFAAVYAPPGKKTACGLRVRPGLVGVAHPVLPCGVKLYLAFGSRHVLTQVIDRAQVVPGREFDLTRKLARLLGVRGTKKITWRFAR